MPSSSEIFNLSDLPTSHEATGRTALDPEALLALRLVFLLLDAWDRNVGGTERGLPQTRITPVSRPECQVPRQGNAVLSPQRQDHPCKTR